MLQISVQQQLGEFNLAVEMTTNQGVTAIFGKSGAGKSSLINLIAGLSTPNQGKIVLNQRVLFDSENHINLPPEKRRVGYVFQEPRLFPHYRVEANLNYGNKRSNSAKFSYITQLLGIEHLLHRYPNSLSGGEKQRVAIGRALLSEPDILLMDEPLSALDLPRKKELLDYLSQLAETLAIPILYVSHSLEEVVRLADQLLLLENGKVAAFDRVQTVWNSPAFQAWQPDSQQVSLLELPIVDEQPDYQMLALGLGNQQIWVSQQPRYQLGDRLRITIASRDVSLTHNKPEQTSIRNILLGEIANIHLKTERVDVEVKVADHAIWATISRWSFDELQLTQGQHIYLQIKSISI